MKHHAKQIQRNASRKTNCEIANSFFIKKLLPKNTLKLFQKSIIVELKNWKPSKI